MPEPSTTTPGESEAEARRADAPALTHGTLLFVALAILAGLLLRGTEAYVKSLWLDEFHSIHIASAHGLRELVERVSVDLHPPAYFVWLHFLQPLGAHHMRWLGILTGLAAVFPLLGIARAMGLGPLARVVVCAVFCTAPYQIMFGTELRSYPILELCSVCLVWAAFTRRAPPWWRFLVFFAATAAGLYHHYFMVVAVLVVGAVRLFVHGGGLLRWRTVFAAGTLGVLAFLPWIVEYEPWIFEDPGAIGRTDMAAPEEQAKGEGPKEGAFFDQDPEKTLAVPLRTLIPRIRSLGSPVWPFAAAGAALFFATIAVALLRFVTALVRREEVPSNRRLWGVLACSLLGYALTMWACLMFANRLPEQYLMVAAWGWPIAAGVVLTGFQSQRVRAWVALLLAGSCLVMGTSHAFGASREDTREGVRVALAEGGGDALYTGVLFHPPWYAHKTPFDVYAPEVRSCEYARVPRDAGRVVVVTRRNTYVLLRDYFRMIEEGRELVKTIQVDERTFVHVFEPK